MLQVVVVISVVAYLAHTAAAQEPKSRKDQTEPIRRMLTELHDKGEFNGIVVVAQAGSIIYREAIAPTPDDARKLLTIPSNIGSVAKGFTAMAVMMLAEQRRLNYDEPIAHYVTELAGATPGITIRHLLTHTSGIPDVGDLDIDRPRLRESEVVNAILKHHARFARPGLKYRYSNTGYILLAMAVENVSGRTFDQFLQDAIFEPLGMNSTRPERGPRTAEEAKGYAGLFSTADDLLKWDQALAGERLVRAETLMEGLVPPKVAEGESNYAFGWNVMQKDGDTYMWHQGNAGGPRAFLGRRVRERIAIIILTTGNSRRIEIADAIVDILHGRPFVPPKLSIARRILPVIDAQGVDAAVALYEQLRTTAGTRYDFSEAELNSVGYALLEKRRYPDAIRVFELNVRQFPTSSNAFDSVGEALFHGGRRAEAAQAYARALELDPSNVNARAKLHTLKSRTWQVGAAAAVSIVAVPAAWFLFSRRRRIHIERGSRSAD